MSIAIFMLFLLSVIFLLFSLEICFFSTFHFSQFNFLKILVIMPLQC